MIVVKSTLTHFFYQVTFTCGEDNVVLDVMEPSKCEYTMKATTPAICEEAPAAAAAAGGAPVKDEL